MSAEEPSGAALPRNVIVVLLDSLNRHMIGPYGSTEVATPHLDRFARRAATFVNHHTGSLPCMPARHDLLCGAQDFLWRPWGSIEVWEDAITYDLRRRGVVTQLVTDHPHLFESGGENYHTDFSAWEYVRGHEDDPWKTRLDPSWFGAPDIPAAASSVVSRHYDTSRSYFRGEGDFPGPRTMAAAAQWLTENAHQQDRFFLLVDEFDPHEPFDTPEPWASLYDADWSGPRVIWPPYATPGSRFSPDERTGRQLRSNYSSKLSMIDHWFGRVLDAIDAQGLWDDTAVMLLTDHGHYFGERGGIWGKPGVPVFNEMGHIPLMIAWPGQPACSVSDLTCTVDVHATLCDIYGVSVAHRTHGHSLVPRLTGTGEGQRSHVLTGVWGREVTYVDNEMRYSRCPVETNRPLSVWSNRWSTMPVHAYPELRMPRPDSRAHLETMPGSNVPVIFQPYDVGDAVPFWAAGRSVMGDQLFDRIEDPFETISRSSERDERRALEALREALRDIEAPPDQLERLGLS